jgi:hypothetical protein
MTYKKLIIAINGNSKEGKNDFINIASAKCLVRHRNIYDILGRAAVGINQKAKKNSLYWNFMEEYKNLLNRYYNSEIKYFYYNIDNFLKNPKVNILFLHALSKEVVEQLRQDFDIITIHIYKPDGKENLEGYDHTLIYPNDNFSEQSNQWLDELLIDKENKEEA